jgi:DNA repair exonuclease SbcCD nuclease subunit
MRTLALAALLLGCGSVGRAASRPATVVVLPDTQYEACYAPETFRAQVEWVVRERTNLNVAAVLHVGDVVENPSSRPEWEVARGAMRLLDGKIPYLVVPGNHDLRPDRSTLLNDYFGPSSAPWIAGVMEAGHSENSYVVLDVGERSWLVVGLEYDPRDAAVAWADQIFKEHASLPAVLLTHAYLDGADGTRYSSPAQAGYPAEYPGNDGEALWRKLVVPNPNVRLVLCGHHLAGRRTSARPDGTIVHEVASDYQWWEGDHNGYGYLRLVEFDYADKKLRFRTYSPTREAFLTRDEDRFELDLTP